MSIEETLKERGSRYGTFEDNADITQGLMKVIEGAPNYDKLTNLHKESFHMIFHKISRAVCGDPMYIDNIHDIGGYAKGLEDFLIELENKSKESEEVMSFIKSMYEKGKNVEVHCVDITA